MADDILKDTLDCKYNGNTYEFAIPSYADEIKIGLKSRDIAREFGDFGSLDGVDAQTHFTIQTAARFEVLLRRSDATWPFSPGADGKPIVDFRKWPKDKVGEAVAVGVVFASELATFRAGGVADTDGVGQEVMASQPNPEAKPV